MSLMSSYYYILNFFFSWHLSLDLSLFIESTQLTVSFASSSPLIFSIYSSYYNPFTSPDSKIPPLIFHFLLPHILSVCTFFFPFSHILYSLSISPSSDNLLLFLPSTSYNFALISQLSNMYLIFFFLSIYPVLSFYFYFPVMDSSFRSGIYILQFYYSTFYNSAPVFFILLLFYNYDSELLFLFFFS